MNRKAPERRSSHQSRRPGQPQSLPRLSPLVIAAAGLFAAAPAHAQTAQPTAFASMVQMQTGKILRNGQLSQWSGAKNPVTGLTTDGRPLMSIEQTQQKALLDWEKFELNTGEVLEFQQQRADWIAVNRVHSDTASRIDGEIRAKGRVFILNDNGVLMGEGATVNTRQLVTGKGVSDVLVDGSTTTIVQSKEKATLNWSDMSLQAGEVLKFQQEKKEWIALNRSLTDQVTKLDGDIKADGHILLVAPKGLSINGKIEAQQVIASSLNIADHQFDSTYGLNSFARDYNNRMDPTFSNTWLYYRDWGKSPYLNLTGALPEVVDPNDPLRYNVTVGASGSISTGAHGKVMLFGPNVTNQGTIKVQDEGQVVMAAGENIYIIGSNGAGQVEVRTGAYNPIDLMRVNFPYMRPSQTVTDEDWQNFYEQLTGVRYEIGHTFSYEELTNFNNMSVAYLDKMQTDRANAVGYRARNEGIIDAVRGGRVDFRGLNLEQMGAVTMTSTALFRSNISFWSVVQDYREYANGDSDGPAVRGNGSVVFGEGSLTQITPDLDSTDAIPLSTTDKQVVGNLKINSGSVHMQEDSIIYLPSGNVRVLLDADGHVFDNNRGQAANQENEDGTRFLMERGATIDLSGWELTELEMGYHQVTGKLYAAQLKDSPLQRDGALYRKEITIDRRYGTHVADWASFDNLNQGTLAQFLIDGGTFSLDTPNDFIMKAGSVIDVSGGKITYKDGYVYTTLLRRLDGSIIDIREADPDELYMGLANEWVDYDTKWGTQTSYYIPLMSSVQGKYETSYVQGGNGGSIDILAPDAVLQGTVKGGTTVGRYQRGNLPKGGSFSLNRAGESESEYVSNNILISAIEDALPDDFGMDDLLSDKYGDFFGEERDPDDESPTAYRQRQDNATLASADFFNRSTMGEYSLNQRGRVDTTEGFPARPGYAVVVEQGANLNLAAGASLTLVAEQRMQFLGSVKTEGGNINLSGAELVFGDSTRLETRGSWYSDYELDEPVMLSAAPRINGGKITLSGGSVDADTGEEFKLILPETMVIDSSGGAWVDRNGKIKNGKGGDLNISTGLGSGDALDLSALAHARAYGLGGNGAFSLATGAAIEISDAVVVPPKAEGDEVPEAAAPLIFRPDFFENSGFSKISFLAPSVSVADGVEVHASSASLVLKGSVLENAVPSAYYAPSGTDIYDVAEIAYLPPEQRSASLRRGMDISFSGDSYIGVGSVLATEVGGSLTLNGSADIHGTLLAPAGAINVSGQGSIVVHENARLLAPGAVLITSRTLASDGRELLDGEVLAGGSIVLGGDSVDLKEGALLDVSGASAVFDLPQAGADGGATRVPTTLASNGGAISVSGQNLQVNDATYLAHAGGAGAKGGSFSLSWGATYGQQGGGNGPTPDNVYENFRWIFDGGYLSDFDGNIITSPFGVDLSRIDWAPFFGYQLAFEPGYTLQTQADLVALLRAYNAAALGAPPVFMVGDNLPPVNTGSQPLPAIDAGLRDLLVNMGGYTFMEPTTAPPAVTQLSTGRIAAGGFSALSLAASPGLLFVGDVTLGGKKADGSNIFDTISIGAPRIMGQAGADVHLEAGVVNLSASGGAADGQFDQAAYDIALQSMGVEPVNADTHIEIKANTLLQVESADFYGYSDARLVSGGDIRLVGYSAGYNQAPIGSIHSAGKLTFKADQVYAATGRKFDIVSEDSIEFLAQDAGDEINGSPYEAAAELTIKAPRIIQGGTVRSPLGTINLIAIDDGSEGAGTVTLLPGSLTSASAEGRTIPFGYTTNGDTWLNPFTGLEMTTLPTKAVNLTGEVIDMQAGAVLDVSGGGNLYAREFVPGIGGSNDWLTGYRDANYNWVSAPGEIFAVMPGYDGDIAPIGVSGGSNSIGVGEKIYLSGGSGLPAGYYTLLPAEYAALPGAFRVTTKHHYAGDYSDMLIGEQRPLNDGSSIQAGYRLTPGGTQDQRTSGYLVMPGATLRMRSQYLETDANSFFLSEAFLKKALRTNRPLGDLPRTPLDGGSVVLDAGRELNLDATLKSAAAEGGRGGFADIKSSRIAVVGANTDLSKYEDGYLILDSDRLNSFGAESLLLGGVRHQGAINLELDVAGTDIVVDNAGSVLYGPELLFASTGQITVADGSVIETRGQISGSSGDLRIRTNIAKLVDTKVEWDPNDDVVVNEVLDQGTVLRLSSAEQVDILRDISAVDAMAALAADPARLASVNAQRAALGYAPITLGGNLLIADGATLNSSRSLAMDATTDTVLGAGASLSAKQISAAASRVSVGEVPAGTAGLVFAGGSLGALANAADITLKSYSSIDFHGGATLSAAEGLRLDTRQIRTLNADGQTVTISGKSLTLANSNGGSATATSGDAKLLLQGDNIYFEGQDKWITGVSDVEIKAKERVIGRDDGALHLPGDLRIEAGAVTADSGSRLFLDAAGNVDISSNGNAALPDFETFGATLGISGRTLTNRGQIALTGGTVSLRAREGDLVLADGSMIDVTSDVSQIFDKTVGVGGGIVNLTADRANIEMAADAVIDVSGTVAGGDAGTLNVSAGLGSANLRGQLKGDAQEGARSGSFSLLSRDLSDFGAFNATLDAGGFRQSRRFEINQGDVTLGGSVEVQELAVIANAGSINLTGSVRTVGDNGGRIQLSAAENVVLSSGGQLLAKANAVDGSGGVVVLETAGRNGGVINVAAGSLIDVSGSGEGGRTVRLRAPQLGSDIGIAPVAGTITGARSVIAEGFRVYDDVNTIDQGVIDTVSADATAFMANAAAIKQRLGSGVTVAPGIELRSDGDMELVTDWDLHELRFDGGGAGVLTLRAQGDLKINANLSDGFDSVVAEAALLNGESWAFNLTAGANTDSPDSMAVLPTGLLAAGKGSLIVGGTADTIEYFYDPAHGNEHRLYRLDAQGNFVRDSESEPYNYHIGWVELERDPATGKYIDPRTGALIEQDPVTGDYLDTAYYARRPLPWTYYDAGGGYEQQTQDGAIGYPSWGNIDYHRYQQWDNSTGYRVRTGTAGINLAAGRDLVLQERPSVIYTAGENAAPVDGFYAPANAWYSTNGGDLTIRVAGDIVASSNTPQMPAGWLTRRSGLDWISGFFAPAADRDYDQTTWYVNFGSYEAGVGALGGGNVDIAAGGDVRNLGVSIPNTGRVTGNTGPDDRVTALHTTGGGNLSLRAGGNIAGGVYTVSDGLAQLTAGGAFVAGSRFEATGMTLNSGCGGGGPIDCNIHIDFADVVRTPFDIYPMLFTSSGEFRLQSGGDLNLDAVMDPLLYGAGSYQSNAFMSYTADAKVSLFSAGGDVRLWNNGINLSVVERLSAVNPLHYMGNGERTNQGASSLSFELWPATLSAVAAAGDVQVLGGMILAPSALGNLELLAKDNVYIGYGTRAEDAYREQEFAKAEAQNFRSGRSGILMSQAYEALLRTTLNPNTSGGGNFGASAYEGAGMTNRYGGSEPFTVQYLPNLHANDTNPVRIYAGEGDIVTTAGLNMPKQTWLQAGNHIYFPFYTIQHNGLNDMSLVRAGNGLYFSGDGYISVYGPGRLEIETGRDFWIPSNAKGITSNRIAIYDSAGVPNNAPLPPSFLWKPEENAADITISTGYNQTPEYQAFEDLYLNPELAAEMEDYLLADAGDGRNLSIYLFDRIYQRADQGTDGILVTEDLAKGFVNYVRGLQQLPALETAAEQREYFNAAWDYWLDLPKAQATPFDAFFPRVSREEAARTNVKPQFYLPERREGLVNYVRRLQGLEPLATQTEQLAYLDQAWAYWQTLDTDYKTPMIRNAFYMELRSTGREANNPDSDRQNTSFRGYDAIATLFPGAQKRADEELAEGESRWTGDFETYASRVLSYGGGKVEFMIPGGAFRLANSAASPGETGQPTYPGDRGDAFRAGVVTADGGEINLFAHDSVTLNESRLLTTKGGNILIWSSYGDIAAGKGAKTSISPPFYDYSLNSWLNMLREPVGLPTGAGIGTLASQPGSAEADVDLVAPNGIVDAGDAGIRVSGNFNVFALEILGTDNIDVAGITSGLPVPPAAPPTSLNVDDAAAKGTKVTDALMDSLKKVQDNSSIKGPSIIEVKVLGYGEDCADDRKDCAKDNQP